MAIKTLIFIISCSSLSVGLAEEVSDWTSFGGNAARSGNKNITIPEGTYVELWSWDIGVEIQPVAISENIVYASSFDPLDGKLYAIDAESAGVLWTVEHSGDHTPYFTGSATVINGKLYYQRAHGVSEYLNQHYVTSIYEMVSLDALTGQEIWSTPYESQWPRNLAPCVVGSQVWTKGGRYGGIYGYNLTNGNEQFFERLPQGGFWTPAYDSGNLVTYSDGSLTHHEPSTGVAIWSIYLGNPDSSPNRRDIRNVVVNGDFAYAIGGASSSPPDLFAVNLESQSIEWQVNDLFDTYSTPAVTEDFVYAINRTGTIHSYHRQSGTPSLTYDPSDNNVAGQVIVTQNRLYAASQENTYIFSLESTQLLQTLEVGGSLALNLDKLIISGTHGSSAYVIEDISNDAPIAYAQSPNTIEETSVLVTLLADDTDSGVLKYVISRLPKNGRLFQSNADGSPGDEITLTPALVIDQSHRVIVQPNLDVFGESAVTFDFYASDGNQLSESALVSLNVTPVNDVPSPQIDFVSIYSESTGFTFYPLRNDINSDGDALTILSLSQAKNGNIELLENGAVQYIPYAGTEGLSETIQYTIEDSAGSQVTESIVITIDDNIGQEWPTFGGNNQHQGHYRRSLGYTAFQQLWNYEFDTISAGGLKPLAISKHEVISAYTTERNSPRMRGIHPRSGTGNWELVFQRSEDANAMGPPTLHEGSVYFTRYGHETDSQNWSINLDELTVNWVEPFPSQWAGLDRFAPLVSDVGIWAASRYYNEITGYDLNTGKLFAQDNSESSRSFWTPVEYQGRIFSLQGNRFAEHNVEDASILWNVTMGDGQANQMNRTVAISDSGKAYFTNDEYIEKDLQTVVIDQLACINLTTQKIEWSAHGNFTGTPAIAGSYVYVLSETRVHEYDANTGSLSRTYETSDPSLTEQPLVSNDLLISTSATHTYIFDRGTTQLLQSIPSGGSLSIAQDILFITSDEARIEAWGRPIPSNTRPIASDQIIHTDEDTPKVIQLLADDPDGSISTYRIMSLPNSGTLYQTLDGVTPIEAIDTIGFGVLNSEGKLIYIPDTNAHGENITSFEFIVFDGDINSESATVSISVNEINDTPVAVDDTALASSNGEIIRIQPLINDYDIDGDSLHLINYDAPQHGDINLDGDTFQYSYNSDHEASSDSFKYTIEDAHGVTTTATITILIDSKIGSTWKGTGINDQRTNFIPITIPDGDLFRIWEYRFETQSTPLAPVLEDGQFTFTFSGYGSTDYVTALNALSGELLWNKATPHLDRFVEKLTTHQGNLYQVLPVGLFELNIWSLDAQTGETRWITDLDDFTNINYKNNYPSLLVYDDNVYEFNGGQSFPDSYRIGLNTHTGAPDLLIKEKRPDQVWDYSAPTAYNGRIYALVDQRFVCYAPETLIEEWSIFMPETSSGRHDYESPVIDDGRAYFFIEFEDEFWSYHSLVCVDLASQKILWRTNDTIYSEMGRRAYGIAIQGNLIYSIADQKIHILRANSGKYLGHISVPEIPFKAPVITNNRIIVSSNYRTYLYDRFSHELLQVLHQGGDVIVTSDGLFASGIDLESFGARVKFWSRYATPEFHFTPPDNSIGITPFNVDVTTNAIDAKIVYRYDGNSGSSTIDLNDNNQLNIDRSATLFFSLVSGSELSNEVEVNYSIEDTDSDNLPDWWEIDQFGSIEISNGSGDFDGDFQLDRDEFITKTSGADSDEYLKTSLSQTLGTIRLSWLGAKNRHYCVQYSENLKDWTPVTEWLEGQDSEITFELNSGDSNEGFYRVVLPTY